MTKTELLKMKKSELLELATKKKLKTTTKMTKAVLVDLILQSDQTSKTKKPIKQATPKKTSQKVDRREIVEGESKKFDIEEKKHAVSPDYNVSEKDTYELPKSYNETRLTLLVQDPYWFHAYWEISKKDIKEYKISEEVLSGLILRLYTPGTGKVLDVEVDGRNQSWYFNVPQANKVYYAELGVRSKNNKFIAIARSNQVYVPADSASPTADQNWTLPQTSYNEEIFIQSGGYVVHNEDGGQVFTEWNGSPLDQPGSAGGSGSRSGRRSSVTSSTFARSSAVGSSAGVNRSSAKAFSGRSSAGSAGVGRSSAGSAGSGGFSALPASESIKGRKFWAELHTELIVYGATEPDAKVTLGGMPIQLTPEGTFSIRFYLRDGQHPVPFVATSNDEVDTIEIVPLVTKNTERREWKNKEE